MSSASVLIKFKKIIKKFLKGGLSRNDGLLTIRSSTATPRHLRFDILPKPV